MPAQKPVYPFTANSTTNQSSSQYQNQAGYYGPQRNASLGSQQSQQTPQAPPRHYYAKQNPYSPGQSTTNLLQSQPQPTPGPSNFVPAASSPRGPQRSNTSHSTSSATSSRRYDHDSSSIRSGHSMPSASEKFNLSPDPSYFMANDREPDDYLHEPDPKRDNRKGHIFTRRGLANLGCLAFLVTAIVGLFAGYPLAVFFSRHPLSTLGAFNLGGTNLTGQIPHLSGGRFQLIDPDTPASALTIQSVRDGGIMDLVFSDEFESENRTFWPGDDPFWEAVDLHYWQTNNLEWYNPYAITTKDGTLQISLSQRPTHGLDYQGGMMSTWNKFCFTGGMILTSVTIPGINNVLGLWPAVWTMGNLGRAGYGASLEGMWPYTYDSCDVGVMPNQTINGQPHLATVDGDRSAGGALSWLPGQKLSRCTCPGEDHPGPIHKEDGSFFGRSAPEIDIFEAQVDQDTFIGEVSQSAQWAPFNYHYNWPNATESTITDPAISHLNFYTGGALQQATSVVTQTNTTGYQLTERAFQVYGFEYKPGYDDAYISWIASDQVAWTINAAGMGADPRVNISARPVPQEPMYIIANLGMSHNFGPVDLDHLVFPAVMSIDWIRVYQRRGEVNIGCDPEDFPTADYIQSHLQAYTDANLTTWRDDYKTPFPKQSLIEGCSNTGS